MATSAQQAANQANAQHSTGPVSPEGKAASSRNHTKHGFRSATVLLPGDDPAEYEELLSELTEHFGPDGLTDLRFIREMADAEWRLRRVRSYLESALSRHMATLSDQHPGLPASDLQSLAVETLSQTGCSYATWLRYETKFERQFDRAYKARTLYQRDRGPCARQAVTVPPPVAEEASSGKLGSNVQTAAEGSSTAPHTASPHMARPSMEPSLDAAAA